MARAQSDIAAGGAATAPAGGNPSGYRADIDGLRAVAVLAVVFFHAGFPGFSGGFVGVDVFFVISGYLITNIILQDAGRNGRVSFGRFYERRVRRLLPALVFTIGVSALVGFILLSPVDLTRFASSALSALFSTSNFHFWLESGYFDAAAELKPLLHTWSLSVEEQYYLVWPLFVLLAWRAGKVAGVQLAVAATAAASLLAAVAFQVEGTATFYLAPFRAYEFAIGASLLFLPRAARFSPVWADLASLVGLALIAAAVLLFHGDMPFPSWVALIPCVGAALTIWGGGGRLGAAVLGNPAARGIGLVSYSLYLIHWPMLVFCKYVVVGDLSVEARVGICVVSLLAATGMYRWVESPFRRPGRWHVPRRALFAGAAAAVLLLSAPLAAAWLSEGWPDRIAVAYDNDPAYAGAGRAWEETIAPPGPSHGTIVLFGDSHAKQYVGPLSRRANADGYTLRTITHAACMSLPGIINVYDEDESRRENCSTLYEKLVAADPSLVIIAYRWPKIIRIDTGSGVLLVDGKNSQDLDRYLNVVFAGIERLLSRLKPDVPVVLIGNVPSARLPNGFRSCAERPLPAAGCHRDFPRQEGEFAGSVALFKEFEKRWDGRVHFIDPYGSLCDAELCYLVRDRTLYYSDHAHLTTYAAEKVVGEHWQSIRDSVSARAGGEAHVGADDKEGLGIVRRSGRVNWQALPPPAHAEDIDFRSPESFERFIRPLSSRSEPEGPDRQISVSPGAQGLIVK